MSCTVEELIKIAEAEIGYEEKNNSKHLSSKGYGGDGNYTKYNTIFGNNGVYWCCSFVCACFYYACGNSKSDAKKMLNTFSQSCETMRQGYKNVKRYYSSPKVGDQIFFSGTRHSGANHTGIVYKVDSEKVYTIEGNASPQTGVTDNGGEVCKKSYKLNYSKIMGYGRPYYKTSAKSSNTTSKATTTAQTASTAIKGIITVDNANVRQGASTSAKLCTSTELKNGLKKGTEVTIVKSVKDSRNVVWYLIKYKGKQGYVSSKCMKKK